MNPTRLELTMSLAREPRASRGRRAGRGPTPPPDADLLRIHTPRLRRRGQGGRAPGRQGLPTPARTATAPHGLGTEDNPIFPQMHEASAILAGGTLAAAQGDRVGPGPPRGEHRRWHAPRDARLGLRLLRLQRCRDRDLLAARQRFRPDRLHRRRRPSRGRRAARVPRRPPGADGLAPPASGDAVAEHRVVERGRDRARPRAPRSTCRCCPAPSMRCGCGDSTRSSRARSRRSGPQIVISQCGVDSHREDPLADLALTVDGQRAAFLAMRDLADRYAEGRWLAVGGGGYGLVRVVPRAWTHLIAAALDRDIDPRHRRCPRPGANGCTTLAPSVELPDDDGRRRRGRPTCPGTVPVAPPETGDRVDRPRADPGRLGRSSPPAARPSRCSDSTRRIPVTDDWTATDRRGTPTPRPGTAPTSRGTGSPTCSPPTAASVHLRPIVAGRRRPTRRVPRQAVRAHPVPALLRSVPDDVATRPQPVHHRRPPRPGGVRGGARRRDHRASAGTSGCSTSADGTSAEVAFVVADAHQGRGLGPILLEHLAAAAAENGLTMFVAEVLAENRNMVTVFREAGYQVEPQPRGRRAAARVRHRPHRSAAVRCAIPASGPREARSVRNLLSPRSVAVIGASTDAAKVGNAVLAQPARRRIHRPGVPGQRRAPLGARRAGLPDGARHSRRRRSRGGRGAGRVDRRGPRRLPRQGRQGAGRGVRGVQRDRARTGGQSERRLVHAARAHGMRLVGPNALGVANTDRGGSAERHPRAGAAASRAGSDSSASPARSASRSSTRPRAVELGSVHLRLGGQPRRRLRQRPAAVLGLRPRHRGGAAVPGELRQSAQVLPDRAPGGTEQADRRGEVRQARRAARRWPRPGSRSTTRSCRHCSSRPVSCRSGRSPSCSTARCCSAISRCRRDRGSRWSATRRRSACWPPMRRAARGCEVGDARRSRSRRPRPRSSRGPCAPRSRRPTSTR